ncbi:MAG: DUF378 domain-containing protein [Burkholderiales bacterium]
MVRLSTLDRVALVLLVIGGLNWGLVGGLDVNLVTQLFGPRSPLSRLLYVAIGIAALYVRHLFSGARSRAESRTPPLGAHRLLPT